LLLKDTLGLKIFPISSTFSGKFLGGKMRGGRCYGNSEINGNFFGKEIK
jgi:hypothetical protein